MKKTRIKALAGVMLLCMAMGELATAFIGFPALLDYCLLRTDWWAEYLPLAMLVNSLAATVLAMFCGVKLMKYNSIFTEKQSQRIDRAIGRWVERRKYGYNKSDYGVAAEKK